MDVVTVKVALTLAQQVRKHWKKIVLIVLSFFMLLVIGVITLVEGSPLTTGTAKVNAAVRAWEPVVEQYADKYGIPDYVNVILGIMMVESGGKGLDIMQSSESLGLPPNTISDPIVSIDVGVRLLASVVDNARSNHLDFWTPVQSYNFGSGFNAYVKNNGSHYSFKLASDFSKNMASGKKVNYSNPIADFNGNYRYAYGNMYYVMLVQQYLSPGAGENIGNADASALGPKVYKNLMAEVMKFQGWPYVWGGSSPQVGFDCSGLVQYAFKQLGYDLPRTSAEQQVQTLPVADPQPGDLIFFKGTNSDRSPNAITHVGIYVDANRMYDADNSGIGYVKWNQGYWKQHFAGFGRVFK